MYPDVGLHCKVRPGDRSRWELCQVFVLITCTHGSGCIHILGLFTICCANGKSKGAVFGRTEVATWSGKTESGRIYSDRCRFLQRILRVRTQELDVAQFDFKQQVSFYLLAFSKRVWLKHVIGSARGSIVGNLAAPHI